MKRLFAFTFVLISIGSSQDTSFYCDPWAQEPYGDYLIENNVWGQGTISEFSQCIFTTNDSSFGWTWDWPDAGYNVKAYPEIIFGKKPWSANSTTNELPLKIGNVETFEVNFDLNIEASGNYNLAFEFWITEDSISNQDHITTEVMIWTANSLLQPAGEQISVFFSDGYYYDLYKAEFDDWIYYAFVSQTDQQAGTLHVHNFINYMLATGHLNPNKYMASFELGNEIVNGSGQTNIQQYSISVNETLLVFKNLIENTTLEKIIATPNPFNPKTSFKYHLFNKSLVKITIFDVLGNVVSNLFDDIQYPGINTVNWEGTDNIGSSVPSGVYFYQIQIGNRAVTNKIMLLK